MSDFNSLFLATTLLTAGGVGLYMYKTNNDESISETEEEDYEHNTNYENSTKYENKKNNENNKNYENSTKYKNKKNNKQITKKNKKY